MADTQSCALHLPALEEIAAVLESGLKKNYEDVQVKVVDCPDLTQEPFKFPVKGLCGKSRIADVGGVPYLVPTARLDKPWLTAVLFVMQFDSSLPIDGNGIVQFDATPKKIYDINTVAKQIELPGAYILGAGAVSHKSVGMNAELIFSVQAESSSSPAVNGNYMASVNPADNSCLLEKYQDKHKDNAFGLLSNLYASEGKPGKVIQVKAKRRTGKENFVSCMRKSLTEHYGDKAVGMGGTFVIQEGKAKLHVMPREFSACPLNTDEDVDRWLNYYEMRAPLICQSVFVSHDPGFDLRVEHTHCFSHHGEGGHYHTDTTPETVQYLGYFHPAEYLYRIDRPAVTHMVGRD